MTTPRFPAPILTAAQMREADHLAIAGGTAGFALMRRAGLAVARAAMRLAGWPRPVAIICGPGNNGGDGFVAATLLAEAGWPVSVGLVGELAHLRGDAALAAQHWHGPIGPASALAFGPSDILVDALFGTGLSRPPEGEAATLINRINASGRPVLAVDVPSGLDSDTGAVMGRAVRAQATVTFAARKPCHVLLPGRESCGEVTVADIGIPDAILAGTGCRLVLNTPALWVAALPRPQAGGHKYTRGHALVIGGPAESVSAARLAAHAALAAGAGLVTLTVPDGGALSGGHPQAVMQRVAADADAVHELLADERRNAILLGPGAGLTPQTTRTVAAVLASGRAVVLDADALTVFAGAPATLFAMIRASRGPVVLTPHAGEFGRLFGTQGGDKVTRARQAADQAGAVIIHKGADTVIAAPDGRAAINDHAPPSLASAGTGDVLAGLVTALLAQGMPAYEAACAAVWLHGDAGYRAGPALIADDLPPAIQSARTALED